MTQLEEARELLRQVRGTWVVMQAADENPYALEWCKKVDRLLSVKPEETGAKC